MLASFHKVLCPYSSSTLDSIQTSPFTFTQRLTATPTKRGSAPTCCQVPPRKQEEEANSDSKLEEAA